MSPSSIPSPEIKLSIKSSWTKASFSSSSFRSWASKNPTHNVERVRESSFSISSLSFIEISHLLTKIKVGIVPISKKDDFASYIGINPNPLSAIKEIVERKIEQVDIMLVNNIKSINNVVIGASVDVYEKYSQFKIKNALSEKIAIAKYASKFNSNNLTISTKNGKSRTEDIFELVIANGGKSKGKLISPLSNVKDGLFNVSYSLMNNKTENLKHLKMFNKGKHVYHEDTKQYWLNNIKISNEDNAIKAGVDGKIYTFDKLDIVLVENGLKIYKAQN